MADSLVWRHISPDDIAALHAASEIVTLRSILDRCLVGPEVRPRFQSTAPDCFEGKTLHTNALLDLYQRIYQFCRKNEFDAAATSALLSIVRVVHERSMETHLDLDASFATFQRLLLAHAVHRPPFAVQVFTLLQVDSIVSTMVHEYYRFYKMYAAVYMTRLEASVSTVDDRMPVDEQPRPFRPLRLAVREDLKLLLLQKQQEAAAAAAAAATSDGSSRPNSAGTPGETASALNTARSTTGSSSDLSGKSPGNGRRPSASNVVEKAAADAQQQKRVQVLREQLTSVRTELETLQSEQIRVWEHRVQELVHQFSKTSAS